MPDRPPITILDYTREVEHLTLHRDASFDSDHVLSSGCEICRAPLTIGRAYPARFGTWRCGQCIGDDGFATASELEDFRATGIIGCPQCGTRMPLAEISPDGRSCRYKCPACRATAQFTIRVPA